MIGCLRTRVHKQPIIALYFESENETETDHEPLTSFVIKAKPRIYADSEDPSQLSAVCTELYRLQRADMGFRCPSKTSQLSIS